MTVVNHRLPCILPDLGVGITPTVAIRPQQPGQRSPDAPGKASKPDADHGDQCGNHASLRLQ